MRGVSRARAAWTWAGIGVVAISAAVMSFATLWRLAERADVPRELAWLLPVAIDATIVVATSVWLTSEPGHRVTRYARGLALSALVLSVAGNAAEHGMSAYEIVAPWWVLVAVSAVPPAALGATVHLAALLTAAPATAESATAEQRPAPPSAAVTAPRATPASDTGSTTSRASAPQPAPAPQPSAAALVRRPAKRSSAGKGEVTEAMREVFDRYVAEGRADQLSGRVLAEAVGAAPSLGRRRLAEWRSELDTSDEEVPAA